MLTAMKGKAQTPNSSGALTKFESSIKYTNKAGKINEIMLIPTATKVATKMIFVR